jgi:DNA-damage-inducible protein J
MKDSTVSARVENTIKTEAEDILQKLGVPVSVVINFLYRQIISSRCSTELHSFYSQ